MGPMLMRTAGALAIDQTCAVRFAPERASDRARVDALVQAAFGPGRFAKTAERLREGNAVRPDLSFCAWVDEDLAAAVRQWPIVVGETPVVFLGPIATSVKYRGQGYGRALVAYACKAARDAGERAVLLVGDAAYFHPLGFRSVEPGRVKMPGPVDPARLHWMALGACGLDGVAGPATLRTARPPS